MVVKGTDGTLLPKSRRRRGRFEVVRLLPFVSGDCQTSVQRNDWTAHRRNLRAFTEKTLCLLSLFTHQTRTFRMGILPCPPYCRATVVVTAVCVDSVGEFRSWCVNACSVSVKGNCRGFWKRPPTPPPPRTKRKRAKKLRFRRRPKSR